MRTFAETKANNAKHTGEYCDYVNALREFEEAHKVYMSLSVFTPEGMAAKQFMRSCGFRYDAARKAWIASLEPVQK